MFKKILIGTHGYFGEELLKSAEMIIGKIENVSVFSLAPTMSFEEYKKSVEDNLIQTDKYLCLVDLFGGTPCSTFLSLSRDYDLCVLTGLNLPLVIEAISMLENLNSEDLVDHLLEVYKESGKNATKILSEGR